MGVARKEIHELRLNFQRLVAYTSSMNEPSPVLEKPVEMLGACFCGNLRRAARIVTRVYEEEYRTVGFTGATQFGVLRVLKRSGAMRQRDLGEILAVDETTLTRTLRPLLAKAWIRLDEGADRREKLVSLTKAGERQIVVAQPAWERAQARIKKALPARLWDALMEGLPEVAKAGEKA
jgi:DNA-binding MarR family transcriptional regulator